MPVATQTLKPRWPAVPYPMNNGSSPITTSRPPQNNIPDAEEQRTPSTIPTPVFESVMVAPPEQLTPSTTHASIPTYAGSGATILQGYCTEPAFTILDGPTAVWVPVVGCISSKADCCPTPTTDGGAGEAPTTGGNVNPSAAGVGGLGGGAQFPISFMPSQGILSDCPKDYHTVGGTACCPSSYWLWSTQLGGQTPCYSSLSRNLNPPPIPSSLADAGGTSATATITSAVSECLTALTLNQKPTSAIVNIAFAMQYPVDPDTKPELKKEAKIGIGVGISGAAVLIGFLLWVLVRKCLSQKKAKTVQERTSVAQRFGGGIDMSRVAHEPAGVARTYQGAKYASVSTRSVNF